MSVHNIMGEESDCMKNLDGLNVNEVKEGSNFKLCESVKDGIEKIKSLFEKQKEVVPKEGEKNLNEEKTPKDIFNESLKVKLDDKKNLDVNAEKKENLDEVNDSSEDDDEDDDTMESGMEREHTRDNCVLSYEDFDENKENNEEKSIKRDGTPTFDEIIKRNMNYWNENYQRELKNKKKNDIDSDELER